MIKLTFIINREVMRFIVEDKVIKYTDRKWKDWIQCVPYDPELEKKVLTSRNKYPNTILQFFNLSEKDWEEYNNAKTEEELANIIIRDAKMKGCKLLRRE